MISRPLWFSWTSHGSGTAFQVVAKCSVCIVFFSLVTLSAKEKNTNAQQQRSATHSSNNRANEIGMVVTWF
jgi:hypothetical protein